MTAPVYTYYLRNRQYQRIDPLDMWIDFSVISRFNNIGSWNLEVPTNSRAGKLITPDTGIIVQRDGATIFSGSPGTDYQEDSKVIRTSGEDDNGLLRALARPTPSQSIAPYDDDYYVATGIASTIMRDIVIRNIGGLAPTGWIIPQLTALVDPLLGSTITARARFDPLITLLRELASTPIATGLGFRILQSDALGDLLLFDVYAPRDKTADTIFSLALKTAADYVWKHQEPEANWFTVAGGDQFGLARTIVEGGDATNIAAIGRRKPMFVDKRGTENLSELNQELAQLIAGAVTVDSFSIVPIDSNAIQFGRDYDLGDLVTVVIKGVSYKRLIREIEITFKPRQGPVIKPLIADPGASNDPVEVQHASSLSNRLSNLERAFNVPQDSITEDMLFPTMKWLPGDLKPTARSAAQNGWLICDGTAISRTVYSRLFAAIGTNFGVGNGTTTFNIPDFRDRVLIGAGSTYSLGQSGGSASVAVGSHSHPHSHTLSDHKHASQPHTHIGSHSHDSGSLTISHDHDTDINHTHGAFQSLGVNTDSVLVGYAAPGAGTTDHHHQTTITALGATLKTSGAAAHITRSGTTGSDSNAPAATYSGTAGSPVLDSTGGPDTTSGGGSSVAFVPKFQAAYHEIYVGIETS